MAKQSWKQEMYQQLANSQVQQILNEQRNQDLQMAQNLIAQYQPSQDDLAFAQNLISQYQPAQQPKVNQVKAQSTPKQEQIPSLEDFFKPKTASGIDVNKAASNKIQREDYQRQQQLENMLADPKSAQKAKQLENNLALEAFKAQDNGLVGGNVNQLDLSGYQAAIDKAKQQSNEELERQILNADKYVVDDIPQLTDEQKALEEQIANFDEYQINKSNPEESRDKLAAYGWGASKLPFMVSKFAVDQASKKAGNILEKGAKVADFLTGEDRYENLAKQAIEERNAQTQGNYDWMKEEQKKANEANPLAYGLGNFTTQAALYAITGPLFDGIAEGAGVTNQLAKFFINQGAQNVQDLVLDTAPLINDLMADGSMSKEDKKEVFSNVLWNAVFNAGMGVVSEIPNIKKWANTPKATEAIPGVKEVDDVVANATKQAEDAAQNIEDISKQIPEVPVNDVANDVKLSKPRPGGDMPIDPAVKAEANRLIQEEAIENAVKAQQPEIPEAPKIIDDDIRAQLDYDFDNLSESYYGNRESIREALENKDFSMPDLAINEVPGKSGKMEYQLVDPTTQRPVKSFKSLKAAEKAQAEYAAGDALKAKAIKAFEDLDGAIFNYEKAAYNAADVEEVNTAKKAVEAARKRYERAMKELDPSYYDAVSSKDFADRITRPYYTRNPAAENPVDNELVDEMVNDWVKQDMDNPNRFLRGTDQTVQDQLKQSQRNLINMELEDNKIKQDAIRTGYHEGQMVTDVKDADSELRKLSAERAYKEKQLESMKTAEERMDDTLDALQNHIKQQKAKAATKKNYEIQELHGKNGKSRYQVVERVSENMTQPVEKKTYKTIDEANEAVYRFKNADKVEGANPLQTFAGGNVPKEDWKISQARTNTFENQGWGKDLNEKDFAYRVQHTPEQHEIKAERYGDSENVFKDLMSKDYDTFDAADVKASMDEIQSLIDNGDIKNAERLAKRLAYEGREGGRTIQAFAEYNKNSISGALRDAANAQEDFVLEPWRKKNVKAKDKNSRIAKALADMGHNEKKALKPELTHDQIKNGVIAELNKEVGSVEKYFNDNDIEFLTQLAEDKSIPVWKITSEIEYKLKTGDWYTLDESIDLPKPTNGKLQSALNSLVEETVRAEKEAPSLKQITEEVRNTLGKDAADIEGQFTDADIDYLANLIHEGATKEELAQALDLKMATGSWGISDATLEEVNNIFKEISNYDPNSKKFVEGQAKAYELLANEIVPNATLREKFEAWRYIAMLGNPKTMLRNYIGNKTFNVVTGISNNVAAVAEAGIDKASKKLGGEGIQRTKAILNPVNDKGLIKACAEDADASRYRQIIGSKYEKMDKDTLKQAKSVFNSKLAQLYEKVTDAGISDYSAVKKKYSTSLAGYMKANGMTTDIFKAEDELRRLKELGNQRLLSGAEKSQMDNLTKQVADLNKARDYALKQAEYATFHEDNAIASVLSKWSRTSKEEGTGLGSMLIEGVVPFKKTPANVLKSGYEYSPLGAIRSIKKTGKLIYENTGKRAGNLADVYKNSRGKDVTRTLASDVIDSWSKTLTGTGLTALGYYLYNKGILHSSNPDTKYQDQLEGHQNYAIEINGKSYTVDWAAPTIMPLMVGAEVAKLWDSTGKGDEDFYKNIDGYVNAANRLADPLIETSMLSGVKDTLETAASAAQYNENLNVPTLLAYNTITGYATQGVPTLGGQIARTIDPTRRSTYTDKEGVAGILDKQTKKLMNKIPGLSYLNQPYVDTYGREQQNSPFNNVPGNLAYQMLSPGYLSNINETDADKVSREAYEVGKTESTLPKWQSKFTDAEGNRVSPEDYTKASKAYGVANKEIRDALANDQWFKGLSGEQKEEIVKGINTIALHTGNAAIDPEYSKDSKPYNAYKEGGIPGLIDYYKTQDAKNTTKDLLGDSGVTTNSNAGKAIQAAVESGDMKQAEKLAAEAKAEKAETVKTEETKDTLSTYGLTSMAPAKTYEKAQSVIPGLTTEKFATTYKKIDNDGNQSIKQDEIIDYLNSNNISESEGKKIWEAYGSKSWKKIPKLENGKWKKK